MGGPIPGAFWSCRLFPSGFDHFRGSRIVLEGLRRASIPVLMNEGLELTIGEASVFLAGLDSVSAEKANPKAAFSARKNEPVTLVLVHETGLHRSAAQTGPGRSATVWPYLRRPGPCSRPRRNCSADFGSGVRRRTISRRREPGLHQPRDRHGRPSFPVQLPARSDGDYACARRTVWLESEYMLVETGPLRST